MGERRGTKGLELWCKKITEGYPGVKVENMTTSWRDGLAFCALIHHFRPELIEFSKLDKDDVYRNNELAFRVAEQYLGIPALLDAEDMVDYPVPDRLSILTYLSQFYQTFNHSDGSPLGAAKRTSSVPDRSSIVTSTATSSPPKKMCTKEAIQVGIPRREPCGKCGLPVFIAERLNVGKQLYHRTCFRCARCNSQLSLANYYETETNNQYCCETCPDEEVDSRLNNTITSSPPAIISRALSDEEKTNQLQADDDYSAEFETALESQNFTEATSHSEFNEARTEFLKDLIEDNTNTLKEEVVATNELPLLDDQIKPTAPPRSIHLDLDDKPQVLPRTKFLQDLEAKPPDYLKQEDKPPELPLSKCPSLNNIKVDDDLLESCTTKYASLGNLSASVVNESGFHSLSRSVNKSISDKNLDDNSITKENVLEKSSLVKARMRLFETNVPDSSVHTNALKTDETILTNLDILNESNECNNSSQDVILVSDDNSIISISDDSKISIEPIEALDNDIQIKVDAPIEEQEYPDDLNPFGDDEEDNYDEKLNPFGDDDDDDKSSNPFDNGIDDIKNVENKKLKKIVVYKDDWKTSTNNDDTPEHLKKIVIKRTRLTEFERRGESYNPGLENDSPIKKVETYQKAFFGSTSSISSETTSTPSTRKKKSAPRPPIPNFSPSPQCSQSSSPSNSLHPSPRLRKNRKAPPPPIAKKDKVATTPDNDLHKSVTSLSSINEYNSEKQIKDEVNLKRRSQGNCDNDDPKDRSKVFNTSIPNKSTYGKWKRKKGQAPPRPIPQKRSIKPVSLEDIRGELDLIEIQQQGLEKQGVRLEKMIREQCEGPNSNPESAVSIETDDLILQLFEVVNEKNELFRRQAELMYIQRQHALEEEQAEVEYQIRCLMLQPEVNKTDSDKAKEEELINRLVNIVERRNEIVDCLERERVRDFEEDESISTSLNLYATKRDEACLLEKKESLGKKSKKFKIKTLYRKSKTDIDKDIDESELSKSSSKEKKHKKFNLF